VISDDDLLCEMPWAAAVEYTFSVAKVAVAGGVRWVYVFGDASGGATNASPCIGLSMPRLE